MEQTTIIQRKPIQILKPLTEIKGFKLRVENCRIIINIDNQTKILKVEKIGHRKNIYKK